MMFHVIMILSQTGEIIKQIVSMAGSKMSMDNEAIVRHIYEMLGGSYEAV